MMQRGSVQHHPSFEPPRELADGIRVQDVVLQGLARLAELDGHLRLLRQVLAGQPRDLLLELRQLGRSV